MYIYIYNVTELRSRSRTLLRKGLNFFLGKGGIWAIAWAAGDPLSLLLQPLRVHLCMPVLCMQLRGTHIQVCRDMPDVCDDLV